MSSKLRRCDQNWKIMKEISSRSFCPNCRFLFCQSCKSPYNFRIWTCFLISKQDTGIHFNQKVIVHFWTMDLNSKIISVSWWSILKQKIVIASSSVTSNKKFNWQPRCQTPLYLITLPKFLIPFHIKLFIMRKNSSKLNLLSSTHLL